MPRNYTSGQILRVADNYDCPWPDLITASRTDEKNQRHLRDSHTWITPATTQVQVLKLKMPQTFGFGLLDSAVMENTRSGSDVVGARTT